MEYMCDLCRNFFEQEALTLQTSHDREIPPKNITRVLSCESCLPLLDKNKGTYLIYKREPFAGGSAWRYRGEWREV